MYVCMKLTILSTMKFNWLPAQWKYGTMVTLYSIYYITRGLLANFNRCEQVIQAREENPIIGQ